MANQSKPLSVPEFSGVFIKEVINLYNSAPENHEKTAQEAIASLQKIIIDTLKAYVEDSSKTKSEREPIRHSVKLAALQKEPLWQKFIDSLEEIPVTVELFPDENAIKVLVTITPHRKLETQNKS